MRYKVWQSDKNKYLHLLCEEGVEAFNALPAAIRHLAPGSVERRRRGRYQPATSNTRR